MTFGLVIIIIVGLAAYVRFAPSDPVRWNVASRASELGEKRFKKGYIWREAVEDDGKDRLAALDQIVMATPRTTRLAGSVDEGQITYITRSQMMGFPDYTTIGVYDGAETGARYLEINGRLRFGRSDLGVNAKRIKGWLNTL